MGCNTLGFPVLHCLPEFAQTNVHRIGDAVQPYHPLSPAFPQSSCPQSFPASESLPMSPLLASGGQTIGPSVSVLPMNSQDGFPIGLADFISLLSKELL